MNGSSEGAMMGRFFEVWWGGCGEGRKSGGRREG